MRFFDEVGTLAMGSRLRFLTDQVTADAAKVYRLYDIDLHPKWFPVFYLLSKGAALPVTTIAREIGHSHPSVSKIIREMTQKGYVVTRQDDADGRRNVVGLSEKGMAVRTRIQDQYKDVNNAIAAIAALTRHDLWKAMEEWEYLLEQQSLFERVQEQKKQRETQHVTIVPYEPAHQTVFRQLNEAWITQWFKMEAADYKALDDPQGYILDNGGHILVALYKGQPAGVCALLKMDDPEYDFELAKMAVDPAVQGKNIGWLLGQAVIEKARSLGAHKLYLESNTILKPAINLYKKLGFHKVAGHTTPYERCNIQMELSI